MRWAEIYGQGWQRDNGRAVANTHQLRNAASDGTSLLRNSRWPFSVTALTPNVAFLGRALIHHR